MSDPRELLRRLNPEPGCQAPPIERLWARLESDGENAFESSAVIERGPTTGSAGGPDADERRLVVKVEAGLPRRSRLSVRLDHFVIAASLLVVIAVSAAFIGIRGPGSTGSPADTHVIRIVLSASPLDPKAPLSPAIGRSVEILRQRLDSVFRGVHVSRVANGVMVVVPKASGVSRERILALVVPARLEFYDWEANALTPNGKTVASQLPKQDRGAIKISQGNGSTAPGQPGAGSLALYKAVKLASKQPPLNSPDSVRSGPQYYLFGAPGSTACQTAAKAQGTLAVAGVHCLLSGPSNTPQALGAHLPAGISASQGRRLKVPRGIVVLQAEDVTAATPTPFSSPAAQFYVLKDNPGLSGQDITKPKQSTDQSGTPDVTFGFDAAGETKFQNVTAQVAHRGALTSQFGQQNNQHFAVALDNKLITVPSIDYKIYPDGITGGSGADITGGFTIQAAHTLATLLRYGPLSVSLATR
jgi:SecD/SecF fusion protein